MKGIDIEEPPVRRRRARVALAVGVLAAALLAGGVIVALASAPAFISGALSQVLSRHVSIGSIEVRAGLSMRVELTDVQIHASSDPASEVVLEAPRAEGTQGWPRVLVGQLVPLAWKVQSPTLRLRLQAGAAPAIELPAFDLSVSGGRVEIETPRGPYSIEKLNLEAARGLLLPTVDGTASGELHYRGKPGGRFDVAFSGGFDRSRLRARLASLDLARVGLPAEVPIHGSASGQVNLELRSGDVSGTLDLAVVGLSAEVPQLSEPIAPQRARLVAEGRWSKGVLSLQLNPLEIDDLVLRGPASVSTGPEGRLSLALAMGAFAPGQPAGHRLNPLKLLGLRFVSWRRIHDAIESGQIEDGKLEINLPLSALASLSFSRPLRPEEFKLHLHAVAGVYRAYPDTEPFVDINGDVDLQGDVFDIRGVKMKRFGEPFPQIDVTLDGFSRFLNLPVEERYVPKGPGVGTPGLAAAVLSLAPPPTPEGGPIRAAGSAPAEPVVHLDDFHIEHPALLLPIRNATADLRFREGRLLVEDARGIVAGGAADLRIEWDRIGRKVAARLHYDYGAAGSERRPSPRREGAWLSGRFALDRLQLGVFPLRSLSGRLSAQGADVELSDVAAQLSGGKLSVSGELSLATQDAAPVALALDLRDADVADVARLLSFREDSITGRGNARGPIRGALDPGAPFLAKADVQLDVDLRDGKLRKLPEALQLARLPSLQGVLGLFGRAMRYQSVEATFTMRQGVLRTERFTLLGPELRILAAGEVDLNVPEKTTDMVVALLFVQTLDNLIEKVPLLGSWVLGDDESLFAVYLRMQGPWDNPEVGLVPPNSLQAAAGWAGRMIGRGVQGLRGLRSLIPGQGRNGDADGKDPGSSPPKPEANPPAPSPRGGGAGGSGSDQEDLSTSPPGES